MSPFGRYILRNATFDRRGALQLPHNPVGDPDGGGVGIRRLHFALLNYVAILNCMSGPP